MIFGQKPVGMPKPKKQKCKIKIKKNGESKEISFSGDCSPSEIEIAKQNLGIDN